MRNNQWRNNEVNCRNYYLTLQREIHIYYMVVGAQRELWQRVVFRLYQVIITTRIGFKFAPYLHPKSANFALYIVLFMLWF